MGTPRLHPTSAAWNLVSTLFMPRLTMPSLKPRDLRRRPRGPWLMLLALLMNSGLSKIKKALEAQIGEIEMRLGEANDVAAKGGRAAVAKLENRIRELEIDLGATQAKTGDIFKGFQKAERRVKELQFQTDEDKKNQDRMSELASKLQAKIKTYKKQIEEAEEIAAMNLAKFRKAQQDLEENEERAKMAGAALQMA